jgi:hypothetical protein
MEQCFDGHLGCWRTRFYNEYHQSSLNSIATYHDPDRLIPNLILSDCH